MIDTIKLKLHNPVIDEENANLVIEQPSLKLNTKEILSDFPLPMVSGDSLNIEKAYGNDHLLGTNVHFTRHGSFVRLSLPRFISNGGPNLPLIYGPEHFNELLQQIEYYLEDSFGIITNIAMSSISRIDLFQDEVLPNPYSFYKPIIDSISFSRASHVVHYDTGVLVKNSQREIYIYDKSAELVKKGFKISEIPNNLIRAELRYKNSRSVKRHLGIENVSDITSNWDALSDYKYRTIRDTLEAAYFSPNASNRLKILDSLNEHQKLKSNRIALREVVQTIGYDVILDTLGGEHNFKEFLYQNGFTSKEVYETKRTLMKLRTSTKSSPKETQRTFDELLSTFSSQSIAVAA